MWVILVQHEDDSQILELLNVHRRTLQNESWYVNASTGPSVICIHAFSCVQTHCRVWRLVFRWLFFLTYHSLKGYCLPAPKNNNNKKKNSAHGKNTIAGFETMRGAWGPSLSSAILSSVTHAARESSSSLPNTETDAPVYALSGVKCWEHHICKNDQAKAQWRRRRGGWARAEPYLNVKLRMEAACCARLAAAAFAEAFTDSWRNVKLFLCKKKKKGVS